MRTSAPLLMCLLAGSAYAEEVDGPDAVGPAMASRWELSLAAGMSSIDTDIPGMFMMGTSARSTSPTAPETVSRLEAAAIFGLRYRISDRITWSVPTLSFAYAGGSVGRREWIPWGGLTSWGAGFSSLGGFIAQGKLGAGIALREWLGSSTALNLTAGASSEFTYLSRPICTQPTGAACSGWDGPMTWVASASGGISHRLGQTITVNLGVGLARVVAAGDAMDVGAQRISLGSVQDVGLRRLPTVEAQLNRNWTLDGYAAASYAPSANRIEQHYLVGFTRRWLPEAPAARRQLASHRQR
jgi:hypothetical protein